jgi:hypothetical protein
MSVIKKLVEKKNASGAAATSVDGEGGSQVEREKLNKVDEESSSSSSTNSDSTNSERVSKSINEINNLDEYSASKAIISNKETAAATAAAASRKKSKSKATSINTSQKEDKTFDALIQNSSKLPIVKFDSDGDFFKEPLESLC